MTVRSGFCTLTHMSDSKSVMEARRDQMFPVLDAHDIARLRRFGEVRHFPAGTRIMKAGEIAPGLVLVLKGNSRCARAARSRRPVHRRAWPGQFPGRAGAIFRPARAGGRHRRHAMSKRIVVPPRAPARCAGAGSRTGRAADARPDPAPGRPAGIGSDRSDPDRAVGQRRHAAAGEFPHPQRPSASQPGFRHRLLRPDPAGALSDRPERSAHRAVPRRPVAAQSRRKRIGALHRAAQIHRSRHDL